VLFSEDIIWFHTDNVNEFLEFLELSIAIKWQKFKLLKVYRSEEFI